MIEYYSEYADKLHQSSHLTISRAAPFDCNLIQYISKSLTVPRGCHASGFVEYIDPGINVWKKRLEYSDSIFVLKKDSEHIGFASLYSSRLLTYELFPDDAIATYIREHYADSMYLDQIGILPKYQCKGYGVILAKYADNVIRENSKRGVTAVAKKDVPSVSGKILERLGWAIDNDKTFYNGLVFHIYTKAFTHV